MTRFAFPTIKFEFVVIQHELVINTGTTPIDIADFGVDDWIGRSGNAAGVGRTH